jgi:hypothetical protein
MYDITQIKPDLRNEKFVYQVQNNKVYQNINNPVTGYIKSRFIEYVRSTFFSNYNFRIYGLLPINSIL